jgi:hypothetical protein
MLLGLFLARVSCVLRVELLILVEVKSNLSLLVGLLLVRLGFVGVMAIVLLLLFFR